MQKGYFIFLKTEIHKSETLKEFMDIVENNSLIKVMKWYNAYKTTGRGTNRNVMCDPYIWVLVAVELNPMLYAEVTGWLNDKLILDRIGIGDKYNTLSRAVSIFDNVDYAEMADKLNWIVFNKHGYVLDGRATQEQLKELETLQSNLAFCIEMGTISSFSNLMNMMRSIYVKKWGEEAVTSKNVK